MLAEIELANPSMELRPGMYASVQLGIERHNDVLMVPSAALLMEKTNAFVFTADQGKAHKVPIKMGFNDGTQVEVVDGVTPSESIILLTKSALSDGQVVQVLEGQ
jgi:multidrug efflux pump subunit AcrA (membrane-fusion protein)